MLCDGNELESALLNLCINARDAMPEGGRLMIGTDDAHLSADDVSEEEALTGEFVQISADTGEGMPPEVVARAFEPFYTTKPPGQGTGLGLSQVYGFVRQSRGIVRIESAPRNGTTIRLYLPRHDRSAALIEPVLPPDPQQAQDGEPLLLVDDEDNVHELRRNTCGSLATRYWKLRMACAHAQDGLPRLDLLVTDVGLPNGMNGRQLAEAVQQQRPGLPVLTREPRWYRAARSCVNPSTSTRWHGACSRSCRPVVPNSDVPGASSRRWR